MDLQTHVAIGKLDVIAITETWLNDSINDLEILPSTFTIHRKDRGGRGGGVLLAVRSNIQCFRRMDLETDCELLWCEVFPVPSYSYFIGVFYRPPNNDLKCLQELAKSLEKLEDLSNRSRVLLLGDFNLPDIDWNVISPLHPSQLSDFFCDCIVNQFCLTQVVDSPTHSDSILDLILTDSPENIMDINIGECLGSSDHNIINFTLVTQVTRPLQPSKLVYNYKNANWDCFRTELSSAPWDSVFADNNTDNIWERWKHLFFKAVRNNIPSKRIKPRKNVPWITSHIRRLFHKRKRLWKRAKASNNQNDWNNYRRIRNQTKSELNKSYWLHVSSLIESKNPKRFWSFIKSKTKYQSVPPTVQLNDEVASTAADKAQLFNNFFLSIFNESDTAPPSTEAHTSLEDVIGDLICQESDVTKILLSLNTNKACGPDGVTARLLREASSSIVPSLTRLFNSSLALGKLPCE